MRCYNKITPDGTGDLLYGECARRSAVGDALKQLYEAWGYRRVMTPVLEFYDVYGCSSSSLPPESMYKLTDTKGRLMVLCPDCTVPIARLAATRLKGAPLPLRLFYSHNIYRMNPDSKGKSAEVHQIGIELIGSASMRSDLEALALAAKSLEQIGPYRLELCHIGYFKALIDSLDADQQTKEEIRLCVEQKNFSALTEWLSPYQGSRAAEALRRLPALFGGAEVLDEAYALFDENGARESLDYLKKIYAQLQQLGLGERILIDLGLVNQADYYTGIIFRGYFDGLGEHVLSGGRYDNLLKDFGEDLPAVGFAVNLASASRKAKEPEERRPEVLVYAAGEAYLARAQEYLAGLRREGVRAENCVEESLEAAFACARASGIPELHIVGETVERRVSGAEEGAEQRER